MKHLFFIIVAALSASFCAHGQVAVKTNLLYDATTTPNIGVEVGVGGKSTVNLVYGLNAWSFNSDSHGKRFAKHWVLMPEYRWWLCSRFSGHFFGVHAMAGQLNAANVDLPLPGGFVSGLNLREAVKDARYQVSLCRCRRDLRLSVGTFPPLEHRGGDRCRLCPHVV